MSDRRPVDQGGLAVVRQSMAKLAQWLDAREVNTSAEQRSLLVIERAGFVTSPSDRWYWSLRPHRGVDGRSSSAAVC